MSESEPSWFARFVPLAVELLDDEEETIDAAHDRMDELDRGSIVVLPELIAWSPEGSEHAYVTLAEIAETHDLSIITTLNLPPELAEDLPARAKGIRRNNAVCIFTRRGEIHVPQAKRLPLAFERSEALAGPGIAVEPYERRNRVRLDVGEALVEVELLVGGDLYALAQPPLPDEAPVDLLVAMARLPRGAEARASQVLAGARTDERAQVTLLVNAGQAGAEGQPAAGVALAEAGRGVIASAAGGPLAEHFLLVDEPEGTTFADLVAWPGRDGRLPVPRALAERTPSLGRYPLTICL